ncbi:hypothetical protein Nepgr_019460 [Nepenthes gracilis]|uniref:Neprosin PEP catalytic domain-containing protein n=1 Tax=Nepenthes gracilis TaxID=150966 RepID=A0AAD3SVC3_NEPGR|nr:hypothetical protein Nepgr_019460 [Nepenthes gracilis]
MAAACWTLLLLAAAFLINSSFIHGRDIPERRLAKPPKATIKTIKWDNGDIFDCVDIYKQPAFKHPNLKNHKLQYAVIEYNAQSQTIQGAQATIDIWDPSLTNPQRDFSLTQIWYIAGSGSNGNTAEAGWQVYPARTGDSQPRLFVFWTADGYNTGCYDLTCPGFVQTSDQYTPGMALTPSTYNGQQNELGLVINKDIKTGNFWLYVDGTAMGYWPNAIYNTLQGGADIVEWGGEIVDSSGSGGFHTLTQMGSGYLPSAGYGQSSYIRNLLYTENTQNWVAVTADALNGIAPAPNCYNYALKTGQDGALWLFYGGPGCN